MLHVKITFGSKFSTILTEGPPKNKCDKWTKRFSIDIKERGKGSVVQIGSFLWT
jgi:hypothetical protein